MMSLLLVRLISTDTKGVTKIKASIHNNDVIQSSDGTFNIGPCISITQKPTSSNEQRDNNKFEKSNIITINYYAYKIKISVWLLAYYNWDYLEVELVLPPFIKEAAGLLGQRDGKFKMADMSAQYQTKSSDILALDYPKRLYRTTAFIPQDCHQSK